MHLQDGCEAGYAVPEWMEARVGSVSPSHRDLHDLVAVLLKPLEKFDVEGEAQSATLHHCPGQSITLEELEAALRVADTLDHGSCEHAERTTANPSA